MKDDGRAVAVTDWDGDGDLDLWLRNRSGPQLRLMVNNLQAGRERFVALRLFGTESNRDAIGARVELEAGGVRRVRERVAGSGYLSQSSAWLHFGLGPSATVERLVVHWPAGTSESFAIPRVDRGYRLVEGSGRAEAVDRGLPTPQPGALVAGPAPANTPVWLRTPLPLPPSVRAASGMREGRPLLINLWANWCEPCRGELAEWGDALDDFHAAGLDVALLTVDPPDGRAAAEAFVAARFGDRERAERFRSSAVEPELGETIDVLLEHVLGRGGELNLPTTLLVDAQGRLQLVYLGPTSPERLLADAGRILSGELRGSRRSRYPGRWYFRAPRDLEGLATALAGRGRTDDARYYRAVLQLRRVRGDGR